MIGIYQQSFWHQMSIIFRISIYILSVPYIKLQAEWYKVILHVFFFYISREERSQESEIFLLRFKEEPKLVL